MDVRMNSLRYQPDRNPHSSAACSTERARSIVEKPPDGIGVRLPATAERVDGMRHRTIGFAEIQRQRLAAEHHKASQRLACQPSTPLEWLAGRDEVGRSCWLRPSATAGFRRSTQRLRMCLCRQAGKKCRIGNDHHRIVVALRSRVPPSAGAEEANPVGPVRLHQSPDDLGKFRILDLSLAHGVLRQCHPLRGWRFSHRVPQSYGLVKPETPSRRRAGWIGSAAWRS